MTWKRLAVAAMIASPSSVVALLGGVFGAFAACPEDSHEPCGGFDAIVAQLVFVLGVLLLLPSVIVALLALGFVIAGSGGCRVFPPQPAPPPRRGGIRDLILYGALLAGIVVLVALVGRG